MAIALAWPLAAQPADARIRAEIDRIEQQLKAKPLNDPGFPNADENSANQIRSARDAAENHRLLLSLERLAQLLDFTTGVRFGIDKGSTVSSGLPAFEAEWSKTSKDLDTMDHEIAAANWGQARAAIRALAETARGRIGPLMSGSRGFASATGPGDGLFYMGGARGEADFAKFCASLNFPRTGQPPRARSMLPELQILQEKANAAFVPPRSIEQHPRFIALNSTLKTARELDASKSYYGALYQYVEAVRIFALIDSAELDAAGQAALKTRAAAVRAQFRAAREDHSIGEIFLERAESLVVNAKTADEWRSAFAIVNTAIPAYFATRRPATITKSPARKTVELTLVRWPYT